nr:NADH dehydrogenase [ubiquinone] 1 beta subcomplex subunit 3-like [Procambarus clarkii]
MGPWANQCAGAPLTTTHRNKNPPTCCAALNAWWILIPRSLSSLICCKMGVGEPNIKIPHWSIYKVENVPELMQVQRALASHGLKDPWLRNEVWRYDPKFGTHGQRFQKALFRGFKWGLIAAVATVAIERAFNLGHGHEDTHH